ncbi:UNVERIFIED_ORG: capsid portal protein [Pantoea agglomerans]
MQKTLSQARGKGSFKNVLIHAPGGGKDGVQLLPFSQISAKDEFLNIKSATRNDLRDAHRIPPQLMGAMPKDNGSFGDVEKAPRVFAINEMLPVMEAMKGVNDWLGQEVTSSTRRTSCGGSPSVILNTRMTGHQMIIVRYDL